MICKPDLLWHSKQLFDHLGPKGKTQVLPQMLSRTPLGSQWLLAPDCNRQSLSLSWKPRSFGLPSTNCIPCIPDLQKHSSQRCSQNGDLIILKSSHNTLYCWISVTFRQVHLRQVWWDQHSLLQENEMLRLGKFVHTQYATRRHI